MIEKIEFVIKISIKDNTKYVSNNKECIGKCIHGIKEDNICNDEPKYNENSEEKCNKNSGSYLYMNYFIFLIYSLIAFQL